MFLKIIKHIEIGGLFSSNQVQNVKLWEVALNYSVNTLFEK